MVRSERERGVLKGAGKRGNGVAIIKVDSHGPLIDHGVF